MIPATKLASTWRAAKPTTAAAMTPEASRLRARLLMPEKPDSATATPISRITAYSSRRTKRSRVLVSREIPFRSAASRSACARKRRSTSVAMTSATTIETAAFTQALVWMPPSAANMPRQPRAILFDALGTLVGFEPPAPHLRTALRARGLQVSEAAARQAIRDEISYYRAHIHEGGDVAGLADLRRRSAEAMRSALPGVPDDTLLDALLESLRFFAYPDVPPALRALREAGVRIAVVSNWDASLHERLHETGLAQLVDGALASAEIGSAKPE